MSVKRKLVEHRGDWQAVAVSTDQYVADRVDARAECLAEALHRFGKSLTSHKFEVHLNKVWL